METPIGGDCTIWTTSAGRKVFINSAAELIDQAFELKVLENVLINCDSSFCLAHSFFVSFLGLCWSGQLLGFLLNGFIFAFEQRKLF